MSDGNDLGVAVGRYGEPADEPLATVRLLAFPLRLFVAARARHDEIMHEFALLSLTPPRSRPGHEVPRRLVALVDTLGRRYRGHVDRGHAERDAAIEAGLDRIDLTYLVPSSVARACREFEELMEEADAFCRDVQLLTLPPNDVEVAFRRWYLAQFVDQVAGQAPVPWPGPWEIDE